MNEVDAGRDREEVLQKEGGGRRSGLLPLSYPFTRHSHVMASRLRGLESSTHNPVFVWEPHPSPATWKHGTW
jgi:hypothetical protein